MLCVTVVVYLCTFMSKTDCFVELWDHAMTGYVIRMHYDVILQCCEARQTGVLSKWYIYAHS